MSFTFIIKLFIIYVILIKLSLNPWHKKLINIKQNLFLFFKTNNGRSIAERSRASYVCSDSGPGPEFESQQGWRIKLKSNCLLQHVEINTQELRLSIVHEPLIGSGRDVCSIGHTGLTSSPQQTDTQVLLHFIFFKFYIFIKCVRLLERWG